MAGSPKKRAKREAAAAEAGAGSSSKRETLEAKVAADEVENQIRAIAEAAAAESSSIRGGSRFAPRQGVAVDGLPEVDGSAAAPPQGIARPTASKSLAVLSRNVELALQLTTDYLANVLELENRPDRKQVADCAEAWGLCIEAYSSALLERHPEISVAVGVTLLTYGPMVGEIYIRRMRGAPEPAGIASAAEVAASE